MSKRILTPLMARKAQKFHQLDLVKVNVVSEFRNHFETDFYGIIAYSYMDKYGGTDINSYSIISLDETLSKAVNQIAWYDVTDLTLSDKLSREQIEKILENLRWISL